MKPPTSEKPLSPKRPPGPPPELVYTAFDPLVVPQYEPLKPERPSAWWFGFMVLALVLVVVALFLLIQNPVLPVLGYRLFADQAVLTWSGLVVQASTYVLVVFLLVVVARYTFQMLFALFYMIRYTFRYGQKRSTFTPPISVVVPAYNEEKLIRQTLLSLLSLDYPEYEVIIVDDGSQDNTARIVERVLGKHGNATLRLVTKPNGGKASALNAGIQVAKYDFVLCADGDSNLAPETLRMAVRHMEDPKIGAVAGNVKVLNRNTWWTTFQALEYVEGLNLTRTAQSFFRLVNIVPGPVGLFRKTTIEKVGWYSSDTFAEDCDITLKMLRQGWQVVYEPMAISWTEAPNTISSLMKQRYRWTRGILQAIRKNRHQKWSNFGAWLQMWLVIFEAFVWPFANVFATVYFIYVAFAYSIAYYLLYWWLGLTLLDMAMALCAVAAEKEEIRLVWYAVFYRIFFVLVIDICKILATIEELLGIRMGWGKLERIGVRV